MLKREGKLGWGVGFMGVGVGTHFQQGVGTHL